jgi:hypothetical protein
MLPFDHAMPTGQEANSHVSGADREEGRLRKVYIIDSNYPEDHFLDRADGAIAQHILKALGVRPDLRLALDRDHFRMAVTRATRARCDILHISTHGDENGIAICNDVRGSRLPQGFEWEEFVGLFQGSYDAPDALVMATCNGASSGLARAFSRVDKRPNIIIGSTDERYPVDYVAAWALLYRRFKRSGINRDAAQRALEDICAVVHRNFRYLRWDDERERYLRYPGTGTRFDVMERD